MKILQDIQVLYNRDEKVTWQDVDRFLHSDPHLSIVVAVFILVAVCTCEAALIISFLAGVW